MEGTYVAAAVVVFLILVYLDYAHVGSLTSANMKYYTGMQGLSSGVKGYMIPNLAYNNPAAVIANAWQ